MALLETSALREIFRRVYNMPVCSILNSNVNESLKCLGDQNGNN